MFKLVHYVRMFKCSSFQVSALSEDVQVFKLVHYLRMFKYSSFQVSALSEDVLASSEPHQPLHISPDEVLLTCLNAAH